MIGVLIFYIICTTSGLILMKLGLTDFSIKLEKANLFLNVNLKVFFGFLLYLVSFITWMGIIKNNNVSIIYPIATGLVQISIMLASNVFLGEEITAYKVVGTLIILAGVIILNKGN